MIEIKTPLPQGGGVFVWLRPGRPLPVAIRAWLSWPSRLKSCHRHDLPPSADGSKSAKNI
jgi:hypothetical protein